MKRRLRKKKHLAEFAEFGRPYTIHLAPDTNIHIFLDWLIDLVEKHNTCFGASGSKNTLEAVIELGKRDTDRDSLHHLLSHSILQHPSVTALYTGEEFDLYHEDCEELDTPIKYQYRPPNDSD